MAAEVLCWARVGRAENYGVSEKKEKQRKKGHISFDGDLSNSVFVIEGARPLIICVRRATRPVLSREPGLIGTEGGNEGRKDRKWPVLVPIYSFLLFLFYSSSLCIHPFPFTSFLLSLILFTAFLSSNFSSFLPSFPFLLLSA